MVALSYSQFFIIITNLSVNFSSPYSPGLFSVELSFLLHKFSGEGVQSPVKGIFSVFSGIFPQVLSKVLVRPCAATNCFATTIPTLLMKKGIQNLSKQRDLNEANSLHPFS